MHANAASLAWYDAIDDPMYLTYQRDAITLLPDWERVIDIAMRDPRARGEWHGSSCRSARGFPRRYR